MAWLAGPPPRPIGAAAAVKDLNRHAGAAHQFAQVAVRFVNRPRRLQAARFLAAVGIAEHDFLQVAAQLQVPAIRRLRQATAA